MKELAAAPDRPLHDDEGSLTLAPGWPPASPQPATENPYGNTRERLTNGTAPTVKCQDSRSSEIGILRIEMVPGNRTGFPRAKHIVVFIEIGA